jgi:hypothetical protein
MARAAQLLLGQEQGTDQGQEIDQQHPEVFEGFPDGVRSWPAQVLGEVEDLAGQLGAQPVREEQGHPLAPQAGDRRG